MADVLSLAAHGTAAPVVPAPRPHIAKRLALPALLGAGACAFFALGLHRYLSFEALREHHGALLAFVERRAVLAAVIFTVVYAATTMASLPGGLVLTVTGGLLFGTSVGAVLTVTGATLGATALFLIARSALGGAALRARAGGAVERLSEGFRRGAFSYLLVLRLVPLVPFFVVNLAPAFLGVSLHTYVLATVIGIVPGTLVFSSVGAGLGGVFAMDREFSLSGVLTPQIVTALVGLALLSLAPIAFKRIQARRNSRQRIENGGDHP